MHNAFSMLARGLGSVTKSVASPVRSAGWGPIREPYAGAWQRGVSIDPIGSLTAFSAVFACVSGIAADIAKLRIRLVDFDPDARIWVESRARSAAADVLRRPNSYQSRLQFIEHWLCAKLLHGAAPVLKIRGERGVIRQLHVLDPRRVTPMVTAEGDVYYSLGGSDLAKVPYSQIVPASEIIHDRGITLWHPLIGVSPIYACGMAATQGLRIQQNSAAFFQNMSRPGGALTAPGTIDDVTAKRLKTDWEGNYGGANLGRLAILGDGLKYEAFNTVPAVEAQLIEQLRWTVEDVGRAFRYPLFKLQAGPAPKVASNEYEELAYYTGCLQGLIEAIELCLDDGLDLPAGQATEFDLDGLLRMHTAARFEALDKAVSGAWMAPNEARQRENLPPVAGGASPMAQQQNYSLSALSKRDARPDPFAPVGATAKATIDLEQKQNGVDIADRITAIDSMLRKGGLDDDTRRELMLARDALGLANVAVQQARQGIRRAHWTGA